MREEMLIKLEPAEKALLKYTDVSGSFLTKKVKRLLQLKQRFLLSFLVRLLNLPITKRVTLFWGRKICLPLYDINSRYMYFFGILGKEELPLIKYLIKNQEKLAVFYDIGANHGFYSNLVSDYLTDSKVYAFEPNPGLKDFLNKNLSKNVRLENIALTNKSGTISFYSSLETGASGISTTETTVANKKNKHFTEIIVNAITFDEYCSQNEIPTFIKLDVEGGELNVLKGAEKILKVHSPIIAMEAWSGEYGDDFSKKAQSFLQSIGYSMYSIDIQGEISLVEKVNFNNIDSSFSNFLFIKNESKNQT